MYLNRLTAVLTQRWLSFQRPSISVTTTNHLNKASVTLCHAPINSSDIVRTLTLMTLKDRFFVFSSHFGAELKQVAQPKACCVQAPLEKDQLLCKKLFINKLLLVIEL